MNRKEKLALIAAVVMAQHNGKIPAKDAVSVADYLLQEAEAAVEVHIPH
jgi:hypothetical protein